MEGAKQVSVTSTKGWNWGTYQLEDEAMTFAVNGMPCF
jgi:hypothetical protein